MRPYKSAKTALERSKKQRKPVLVEKRLALKKKQKAACLSLHTYGEFVATQRRAAHTLLCNGVGNAA
jgi:hypothetical protein